MKKLSTLLLASAVAVSASAAPAVVKSLKVADLSNKELRTERATLKPAKETAEVSKRMKKMNKGLKVMSMRKADSNASIEGEWTFTLGDYYFQTSIGEFEAVYEAYFQGDLLIFESEDEWPMAAQYNENTGEVVFITAVFQKVTLQGGQQAYPIQQPYIYQYTPEEGIVEQPTVSGQFNAAKGEITFDTTKGDPGLEWMASTTDNPTTEDDILGYFAIYDLVGAVKTMTTGPGVEDEWEDVGNAIFVDPWVMTAFVEDNWALEYQWQVPLQRNKLDNDLYRLVDPYHQPSCPLVSLNNSKNVGYITFDVSDPDHIVFLSEDAGFGYSGMGITKFYCTNQLSFFAAYYGSSPEEIIQTWGDEMPYTTLKNGIVSLSYYEDEEGIWYDANFGIQSSPIGGYTWQDEAGNEVQMTGQIVFPEDSGVSTVGVAENEKVEYFNLQGVKVANPEKGQIVIVRQGNKTSKTVVK